jgi:radical SAM-linked protein
MSDTRQRWRLVFRRGEAARYIAHLDAVKLWERAFRRGLIPIARTEGFSPRPRLIFAAPLPLGMLAERELADLYLSERLTLPDLRERLVRDLPLGYEVVDVHDVWTGEPSLASRLVAADYRLTVSGAEGPALRQAARDLLHSKRLDRERKRDDKAVAYDLRPLLVDIHVDAGGAAEKDRTEQERKEQDAPATLTMRLRHSQESGSARPDEVVLALGERLGRELDTTGATRLKLWLAGEIELDEPGGEQSTRDPRATGVAKAAQSPGGARD